MTETESSPITPEAVENALLSAIRACAVAADRSPQSGAALQCAQAAHELAQTYAIMQKFG